MPKTNDERLLKAVGEMVQKAAIANGHDPNKPVEFHVCGRTRDYEAEVDLGECSDRKCRAEAVILDDDGQGLCEIHATEWLLDSDEEYAEV